MCRSEIGDSGLITLVFGAGASFGSGKCLPYNPPLGNYLYQDLVKLNGAFSKLSEQSRIVFETDGFEAGMATVANDSRIINGLQKEIACYLSQFSVCQENAYVRLFNKLRRTMDRVRIVTLNYDILIEQALAANGFRTDYDDGSEGIVVLKPHGSSNFLPQVPGRFSNMTMKNCGTYFSGFKTYAVSTHEEVKSWCQSPENKALSPVLSMYEKGKRVVVNDNTINDIQKKYNKLVDKSDLIVLVGIKYISHDQHIWKSIELSNASILVVDPHPEEIIGWARNNNKNLVEVINSGFEKSVWSMTKIIRSYSYL